MLMDPGSDDEDDADDIVRLTNEVQGKTIDVIVLGPRRGNPNPACLLVYGVSTYYNIADGFGVFSLYNFVPSLVPPPSLL